MLSDCAETVPESEGATSASNAEACVARQKTLNQPLGMVLQQAGLVSRQQVEIALEKG